MGRNAYARKMQATWQAAEAQHIKLIRQETADLVTLVLHETFGFGPERQKQFNQALNAKLYECLALKNQDTSDMEYTIVKFEEAMKQACGPYYIPREERYKGFL